MLSVTDLSSYDYCQRKLFLEKVLRMRPDIPKEALVKGSIRHEAYEKSVEEDKSIVLRIAEGDDEDALVSTYSSSYSSLLTTVITKNKHRLEEIQLSLTDAFSAFWPALLQQAKERALAVWKCKEATGLFGEQLWSILTPKIRAEYRVASDTIGIRGIVDRLEIYGDRMIPIEIKTGKSPRDGVWPGHRMQIGAYLLLLKEKFMRVDEGIVHYVDSNKRVSITLNPFLRDDIKARVADIHSLLSAHNVPDRISHEGKCKACGLYEKCFSDNIVRAAASRKGISY